MTITEFLLARIAEDETDAKATLGDQHWEADPVNAHFAQVVSSDGGVTNSTMQTPDAVHVARWDPARVLAEVAAKRAILADHEETTDYPYICTRCFKEPGWPESMWEDTMHEWPCPTVRLLAQPYAEHPDFDPAWRVG